MLSVSMPDSIHSVILAAESYSSANTVAVHHFVVDLASFSMYLLEALSIAIIVFTTVIAFIKLLKSERYARVYLLHGQSLGLTFKLGAEILRTITATSLYDLIEVFLLILIKACMVLLIERELKSSEKPSMDDATSAHGTASHFFHLHKPGEANTEEDAPASEQITAPTPHIRHTAQSDASADPLL